MANTSVFRNTLIDFRDPSLVSYCRMTATSNILTFSGVSGASVELRGIATPTLGNAAATKAYVDSVAAGSTWKDSVRATTTANGTLASAYAAGQTIDGVTLALDDRILLKDQTTTTENGIYIVTAGAPNRASDMDTGDNASGNAVFVREGTVSADVAYICTSDPGVVGTNGLVWTEFTRLGQIVAGDGLSKTANELSVNVDDSTIEISADVLRVKDAGITNAKLANPSLTVTAGDGLQNGGLVALGAAITVDVDSTVVRTTGNQSIAGDKTFSGTVSVTTGGALSLDDSIALTLGTGDDLTFSHDGTNTTMTSTTGNLLIDNTSATGNTNIQLGTDTAATAFNVLNDSGGTLFSVNGAGSMSIANWVFTGNNAGLAGNTDMIELSASRVIFNDPTRYIDDVAAFFGTSEQLSISRVSSSSRNQIQATAGDIYIDNTGATNNIVLKTGSTNDTATSIRYLDSGDNIRFQVNANGSGFFTGNLDVQNGLDVTGAALTTAAGITNTGGTVTVSGGGVLVEDGLAFAIGTDSDLSVSHTGTTTTATSTATSLILNNTAGTGQMIHRLGTTTTATSFDIQNSTPTSIFKVDGSAAVTATGVVSLTNATASTNSTTGALVVTGGTGIGGELHVAGDAYADAHINTSDQRLKDNVREVTDDDTQNLSKLNPITFTWRDKGKDQRKNYGFLAQEVREIYPDLVHEDDDGFLSMDYVGLIAILVKKLNSL